MLAWDNSNKILLIGYFSASGPEAGKVNRIVFVLGVTFFTESKMFLGLTFFLYTVVFREILQRIFTP